MKYLKTVLKKNIRLLRKYKKVFRSKNEKTESIMWFTDNFHIIEKNFTAVSKALKIKNICVSVQSSVELCNQLCANGNLPQTRDIISFLADKKVSIVFFQTLPTTIAFTLIDKIAQNVQANEDVMINAVRSLFILPDIDFGEILLKASETEKLLCQDPTGVYRNMSEQTKETYRTAIHKTAEKENSDETDVAKRILEQAKKENKHIGFFLDIKKDRQNIGKLLLVTEAVIPLIAGLGFSVIAKEWYLFLLLYLPLWEAMKFITDFIFSHIPAKEPVFKMDFSDGIPDSEKTVIAISTLLPSAGCTKDLCENVRNLYLSNCRDNACICILADLKNSQNPTNESDNADIRSIIRAVDTLNRQCADKIILAIRKRTYSQSENEYTGYERKRGAIISLAKLIAEGRNDFSILRGNKENLAGTKYIMALDSDTSMPLGALNELVAIASHPVNRPVISVSEQRVTQGYGIISPRVETDVKSACKTHFSSVMAGNGGLPAYTSSVREKYMELFSESIFSGKGLIDIKTFNALMPDRFPEQKILSHDILEGIILRTVFAGDITLTDSFPSNENAYFRRLHRWIRGDIQNLPFIFKRKNSVPYGSISVLGKYWLADNIRRALTPVIASLCLILSVFLPDTASVILSLTAIASMAMPHLFSCIITLINGGISMFSRLYFSDTMPYALACLAKAFTSVVMMVTEAVCCADAVIRSLFRMIVSKKHLLQWTTSADSNSGTAVSFAKKSIPSVIAGIFLVFYGNPVSVFAGILLILDLPFSVLSARKKISHETKISENKKNRLLSYCASMWRFYETHCNKKNNYLIPDNVQEMPVYREADRTSPTNIGMMLCSFLAARDFDFIDSDELYEKLEKSFETIGKMEKYKGHLYNWYNTRTLEIMQPKFISTVDSGNFLCCIVALAEGLESYVNKNPKLREIIEICNRITDDCDLDFLYDKRRRLFRIGFDTEKNELTSSHFDLLMSEARMTSYFAAASGKVPVSHWQTLARPLSANGRYTGPVSWSGTMFEYFMPAIFIPSEKNTLGYEALRFCIHCQKKRVKSRNIPYGISESGYYAFDPLLNYRYKAHGVSSIAMKTAAENETVISPYSTFLTIPFDPHSAINNLQKLEKIGMYGKFGFYEAVDYTPSRTDGQNYSIVRSYMAHHVGMSFLSAANAVFDNIMQRRFMKNSFMSGGKSLLDERIPSDMKVYKNSGDETVPKRPERMQKINDEYKSISPFSYESHSISNGEWSVFTTDSGKSVSVYGNTCIFAKRQSLFSFPDGIFAAIKNDKKILSFSGAIISNQNHSASFDSTSSVFRNSNSSFAISESVCVHPFLPAQIHRYTIKNKTKEKKQIQLMIYCEPTLENINEQIAHPAFSKLFIDIRKNDEENLLSVTRKQHNKEKQIYVSVGFADKTDFEFCDDREAVIPRNSDIAEIFSKEIDFSSKSADKCIFIKTKLTLAPKETITKTLIICGASDFQESVNRIASICKNSLPSLSKCALSLFDKTSITGIYAKKVIERSFFGRSLSAETLKAVKENVLSRNDLWKTGVSGDYPVILVFTDKNDVTAISAFIKLYSKLRLAGIITEIVFITDSTEGYIDSFTENIRKLCDDTMSDIIGNRGGIFILNTDNLTKNDLFLLTACATAVYPEKNNEVTSSANRMIPIHPCKKIKITENSFTENGYITGKTPYLPWCHIIANRNFGTLVSDSSSGFSWAMNSRENKLTPWSNDTRERLAGELLLLETDKKRTDIIKGATAVFENGSARYLSAADELIFQTTMSVKGENMCKEIKIEILNNSNTEKHFSLYFYTEPVLGDNKKNSRFIKTVIKDNKIFAHNPFNTVFGGFLCISSDDKCGFLTDKTAFLCGEKSNELKNDCIVAERKIILPSKGQTTVKFYLSYSQNIKAAANMPYIPPKKVNENRIEIETPDKELNLIFNNFLLNQIISGRINGRTGFYQCSGAFGFRDQLQDAMAVILTHPEILRTHIIRCAAAQFCEGDVLHWFHQLTTNNKRVLRGVRTHYSDDLLWLPLAVSEYCSKTGDASILDIPIPFLDAPVLEKGEKERYGEYTLSNKKASVYNHCLRAIFHACSFGKHGLPLIKGGDWNDSFNAVGIEFKGESVWLGMFLSYVAKKFAVISLLAKDRITADRLTKLSDRLFLSIDEHAWADDRYLRCFYDDGTPMGKSGDSQCEIDLLPQVWSAIAGMPDKNRCSIALSTAEKLLYDKENSLIKLFAPPFTPDKKIAGYVNRYPEGIRENGGQYTHGAVWFADAYFSMGNGDKGYEILKTLNPATKNTAVYKTEPYYLAGDVYSGKGLEGRGGWSIYTGSAGWFYRTVYEKMLGITQTGGLIITNPCLPEGFEGSKVKITIDGNTREFEIK